MIDHIVPHWPKDKKDYLHEIIYNLRFLPGGRILANAGLDEGTLMNCYILDVDDSLDSIFASFNLAGRILSAGGGVGLNWSKLRENGASVGKRDGLASGPISFIKMFDAMAETIRQGRNRRGACMAILNSDHPDVFDFIDVKAKEGVLACHNISVMIKNAQGLRSRYSGEIIRDVTPEEILTRIAEAAWRNGEPGVMFFENINDPMPEDVIRRFGPIEGSNPCLPADTLLFDGDRFTPISEGGQTFISWWTGKRRVFRFWLQDGSYFDATPDHRIGIRRGPTKFWLPAYLSLGYPVLRWHYSRYVNHRPKLIRKAMLLGMLFIGAHSKWYGNEYLTFTDKKRYERLFRFLEEMGAQRIVHPEKERRDLAVFRLSRSLLARIFEKRELEFLDSIDKSMRELPRWLMTESADYVASFLRGVFALNGVVYPRDARRVIRLQFRGRSEKIVSQLQTLLTLFGVRSEIIRNSDERLFLRISTRPSLARFLHFVGMPVEDKRQLLDCQPDCPEPLRYDRVVDIEDLGIQDVFDFRVRPEAEGEICPYSMTNGVIVHNCSEILAWPYTACCLGSLNLFAYFDGHEFDFDAFERDVAIATEFLDAALDVEKYPDERIAKFSRDEARQIGLGVLGFHDLLIAMEIPYDSEDALEVIDQIGSRLQRVSYETSVKLGGGKPKNVMRTCIAPTGSLQLLAGVSSGIEPHFSLHTVKKTSLGEIKLMPAIALRSEDPEKVLEWLKGKPFAKTALEISPEWHVRILAQWTKWIDSGISKTINLPNSATVEDVYNVLEMARDLGVKSFTVYRDGSREEQVLYSDERRKSKVHVERPPLLKGQTFRRKLGCDATAYVTINRMDGNPVECFINIGKSGGCIRAFAEALGRLISIYLQDVGDVNRLIKQLQGIVCSYSALHFKSCPDLIAELLKIVSGSERNESSIGAMICPHCGGSMIATEGCWRCPFCLYSRCDG